MIQHGQVDDSLILIAHYISSLFKHFEHGLSVREAAEAINVAKDTATKSFAELIQKGFIRRRKDGSFSYKVRHSSEYELTDENSGDKLATKDFMRWVPIEKAGPKAGTQRC